jgi:D-xylose transport system ATP-binding protein
MNPVLLRAENITKRFPGVTALHQVSFDLRRGEIHALCGENGAGKSTLIKLLSGVHSHGSYEGNLYINDSRARFQSTADAQAADIAVIHQELALVEEMTVAENVFLGAEPLRSGFIDWLKLYREARLLLRQFDVQIDPAAKISKLGVGQRQLVEIVKALSKKSKILILDEPTAALTDHEVRILVSILKRLREHSIACIYISHKLDEVFALADRITVLRDGATVATLDARLTNKREIMRHMVGREIQDLFPARSSRTGRVVFRVSDLTVANPHTGRTALEAISFSLHSGEVLGIGGLMGAGRTELLMHLFGAWGERIGGSIQLEGCELAARNPVEMIDRGVVLVSEDRRRYGLVLSQNLGFNLSLSSLPTFTRNGLIDSHHEFKRNHQLFVSLGVRAPGLGATANTLSGGNQQKIVLGKALMTEPRVILLDEPTRGIDVGGKLEIYELINRLTEAGKGVLLVSSELPELIGISDRILMLHDGHISGEFTRAEATPEKLLAAAMGQGSFHAGHALEVLH